MLKNRNAWKWWLTGVLFLATVLTYLDRQTMSLCGPMIRKEFALTNEQFGQLLGIFRLGYAITHVPAGFLADRFPIRLIYGLAVALWSAAGMCGGFARSFRPLLMTRSVLGVGEGFNWPCATRIVANLFPPDERGLASGIFNSGAAVGSLISPLIILPVAEAYGWRASFLMIGVMGFFWLLVWAVFTRKGSPGHAAVNANREFSPAYRAAFALGFAAIGIGIPILAVGYGPMALDRLGALLGRLVGGPGDRLTLLFVWLSRGLWIVLGLTVLLSIYRKRAKSVAFWMLVLVAITVNPCWYFLNDWIPSYLHDKRGFGSLSAGFLTTPIFLAADVGNIFSGGLIKFLTVRGWSLRNARGTTMILAGGLILPVVLVPYLANSYAIIGLLALGGMGLTSIIANYTACQGDFSFANVGIVAGVLGLSSNVCSAIANPRIGAYVNRTGNYDTIFLLVGVVPLVSVAAILVFDTIVHGRRPRASRS